MKLLINNVHSLAWIALNRTNLFVHYFGNMAEQHFSRHMVFHLLELHMEPIGTGHRSTNFKVKAIIRKSDDSEIVCEAEITNLDVSVGPVLCEVAGETFKGSSDDVMEKAGRAFARLLYSNFSAVPVGS